jgi:two-component system, NtrC family, nitrogen regulation response regulator NtrX
MAIVLVVEDEVHVRLVLSEVLRTFNHDVRLAETAAAGVKAFKIERPDAVILDTMLPDASGTVVLDEMRKLRPDVPVVMMSGHADETFAQQARSHGAFDYLAKPFSVDRLVGVLTAALK